jgi:hypothetical protein
MVKIRSDFQSLRLPLLHMGDECALTESRVRHFAVLFPDTSRAGPAQDRTLIFSRVSIRHLITF